MQRDELLYRRFAHAGVAAAALLRILGISEAVIVEEYLLSDGDVKEAWIRQALDGIGDPERYFTRVDLQRVCAHIRHTP